VNAAITKRITVELDKLDSVARSEVEKCGQPTTPQPTGWRVLGSGRWIEMLLAHPMTRSTAGRRC